MTLREYLEYRKKDVLLTYYNRALNGERKNDYIIIYAQSIDRVDEDIVKIYPYCMLLRDDSISSGFREFELYPPSQGKYFMCDIKNLFEPNENEMKEMYIAWKTEEMKKEKSMHW